MSLISYLLDLFEPDFFDLFDKAIAEFEIRMALSNVSSDMIKISKIVISLYSF